MFKSKSIEHKMIITVSLLILLVISISSYLYYTNSRTIMRDILIKEAENAAAVNSENIDQWLKEKVNLLETLTFINDVQGMNWLSAQLILRKTQKTTKFMEIMMVEKNGHYKSTSGGFGNLSDQDYFKEIIKTEKTTISNYYQDFFSKENVIAIAAPITDDYDKLQGFLVGLIKLEHLQGLVKDLNLSGHGYAFLINQNLETIAHPDQKLIGNQKLFKNAKENYKNILSNMIKQEKTSSNFKIEGNSNILTSDKVNDKWTLALTAEEDNILSPLQIFKKYSIYIGLASFIISLIVIYLISRQITAPIKKLVKLIKKVSEGDLNLKVDKKYLKRKDEIGTLSHSIENLIQNLKKIVGSISDISTNLSDSSHELQDSSEEISKAAKEVGSSTHQMAAGMEEQSAQIDDTKDNIIDLSQEIKNIKEKSTNMEEQAENVVKNIDSGNNSIQHSIKEIKNVREKSHRVENTVNELGQSSEQIGDIIELISSISAQTNLLALNAAIEAARAGEAGRGFSVVADEIRDLAEESSQATEEIEKLINNIQNGVSHTAKNMKDTRKAVENSVEAIQTSENSFNEINQAAEVLKSLIKEISTAASKMTENSEEVQLSIKDVAKVSESTAKTAEEIAASSQEQSAATHKIAESTRDLAAMSRNLIQSIKHFQI